MAMTLQQCSSRQATRGATSSGRAPVARPALFAGRTASAPAISRVNHTVVQASSTEERQQERWADQIREGKVRNVTGRDAGEMMKEGWVLLDVRPPTEVEKAAVKGAVEVPLFVPDTAMNLGSFLARGSFFGTGGWWLGGTHTVINKDFLATVQNKIPKDANVIVGCQKGLRSLAACEQLSRAGYQQVAWINGGFDVCRPGDLPTDGRDIRYGGIGGVSELLGWTEVQQAEARGKGSKGGVESALKVVAIIVAIDIVFFGVEQLMYMQSQGKL